MVLEGLGVYYGMAEGVVVLTLWNEEEQLWLQCCNPAGPCGGCLHESRASLEPHIFKTTLGGGGVETGWRRVGLGRSGVY